MAKSKKISDLDETDLLLCTCANLRQASRVVTQIFDAALQTTGLRGTQFTMLAALSKTGPIAITQLAEALVVDRTTLTRNLKPLLNKKLLSIENQEDHRVKLVSLTAQGKQLFKDALPHWQKAQNQMVKGLGKDQLARLITILGTTIASTRTA